MISSDFDFILKNGCIRQHAILLALGYLDLSLFTWAPHLNSQKLILFCYLFLLPLSFLMYHLQQKVILIHIYGKLYAHWDINLMNLGKLLTKIQLTYRKGYQPMHLQLQRISQS